MGKDGVSRCTSTPETQTSKKITDMEEIIMQLQELKQLALIGAKNAFNIEEAAMLTGYSVSHLRKLVATNAIPYYKSTGGKFIYFKKSELENWMLAYRVNTSQEAEQAAAKILEGRP